MHHSPKRRVDGDGGMRTMILADELAKALRSARPSKSRHARSRTRLGARLASFSESRFACSPNRERREGRRHACLGDVGIFVGSHTRLTEHSQIEMQLSSSELRPGIWLAADSPTTFEARIDVRGDAP